MIHGVNTCSIITRFGEKILTKSLTMLCHGNGQRAGRAEGLCPAYKFSGHFDGDAPSDKVLGRVFVP